MRISRSMIIEQRLQIALEISLLSRGLMRAGGRNQHPDWSENEIEREGQRLAFFRNLCRIRFDDSRRFVPPYLELAGASRHSLHAHWIICQ